MFCLLRVCLMVRCFVVVLLGVLVFDLVVCFGIGGWCYVGYFRFEVFELVFDYLVWVRCLGWWFGLLSLRVVCFIGSGFSGLVDLVCLFDLFGCWIVRFGVLVVWFMTY